MTGTDIEKLLQAYGFRHDELSALLGVNFRSVYRWMQKASIKPDPASARLLFVLFDIKPKDRARVGEAVRRELVLGGSLRALYKLLDLYFKERGGFAQKVFIDIDILGNCLF